MSIGDILFGKYGPALVVALIVITSVLLLVLSPYATTSGSTTTTTIDYFTLACPQLQAQLNYCLNNQNYLRLKCVAPPASIQ
jgi:hypothetical protein